MRQVTYITNFTQNQSEKKQVAANALPNENRNMQHKLMF